MRSCMSILAVAVFVSGAAADTVILEQVGQWSGAASLVEVVGDYAYVSVGPRLAVLDISDPHAPILLGQTEALPDDVWALAVAGDYAYVTALGGGMRVVDIGDPNDPHIVNTVATSIWARGMAVSGGYLYLADGDEGMQVYVLTDPSAPQWLACARVSPTSVTVCVEGDYAYLGHISRGLRIIDVSDPAFPQRLGRSAGFVEWDVAVSGGYAFVAGGDDGLLVFDVGDPNDPRLVYEDGGFYELATGVALAGSYVYLAYGSAGLCVYDVSDPCDAQLVGNSTIPAYAHDVTVSGDYLYVADHDNGLVILQQHPDRNENGIPDEDECWGDIAAGGDGLIGVADLNVLLANYGQTDAAYSQGDVNCDGRVDLADLQLLLAAYGESCD